MSRYKGTNVPKQPTVPPMPKKRRYIDESILVEKVYNGEGLPTISRSVLVNCVLTTIPTADVVEVVRCKDCIYKEDCGREVLINEYDDDKAVDITGFLFYCSYGEREK